MGLVDELEDRRLVRRERDADDRRRHRVLITPRGRKVHASAVAAVSAAERDFLAPLDRAGRDTLRRLLVATMTPRLPWLGPDV